MSVIVVLSHLRSVHPELMPILASLHSTQDTPCLGLYPFSFATMTTIPLLETPFSSPTCIPMEDEFRVREGVCRVGAVRNKWQKEIKTENVREREKAEIQRKGRAEVRWRQGAGGQKPSVPLPDHYIKDRVLEGDLKDPVQNPSLHYLALGLWINSYLSLDLSFPIYFNVL